MASRKQTSETRPTARSERILVEQVADEAVLYDLDTSVAHALKPLAAAVFACADGSRDLGEIAEACSQRLSTTVSESDVADALSQLEALDLLEQPERDGVSRRDALKVLAATGAGTMLISSIAAPAALAHSSTGNPCSTGSGNGNYPTNNNCYVGCGQNSTQYKCPLPNQTSCGQSNSGDCWNTSGNNCGTPNHNCVQHKGTCNATSNNSQDGTWQCVAVDCGGDSADYCQVCCVPNSCVSNVKCSPNGWGTNTNQWGHTTNSDYPYACAPTDNCGGQSGYWGIYCKNSSHV